LKIYDPMGRLIKSFSELSSGIGKGSSVVTWYGRDDSGKDVPAGIYFYHLEIEGEKVVGKIIKVKEE